MSVWLCPICGLETVPYGENCPRWPGCENAARAHITGHYYSERVTMKDVRGIGISEISDESEVAGEVVRKAQLDKN